MNPEEKVLLERTLKLSEENNHILRKMQRTARLAVIWGFVKLAFVVIPLVLGYIYLEPFLDQALDSYGTVMNLLNTSN